MIAIAYCRVSTAGQQEDGVSLDMQQQKIAAFCSAHDYQPGQVFVEVQSGGKAYNRPQLQAALAAVCAVKGILVVYSLSRLARSVRDTLDIAARLEKHGAGLASLSEKLDTATAVGRMVFKMLATLHEFERDQLAERTRDAMAHMRRGRRRISRFIPYGWDDDAGHLVPNVVEQDVLGRIERARARGESLSQIARDLTNDGILTKLGRCWDHSTVSACLDRQRKVA